jgi:hypothetical protein
MKKRTIKKCNECSGGGGRYYEAGLSPYDAPELIWEKCKHCAGCGVVQNFEIERKSPYRN